MIGGAVPPSHICVLQSLGAGASTKLCVFSDQQNCPSQTDMNGKSVPNSSTGGSELIITKKWLTGTWTNGITLHRVTIPTHNWTSSTVYQLNWTFTVWPTLGNLLLTIPTETTGWLSLNTQSYRKSVSELKSATQWEQASSLTLQIMCICCHSNKPHAPIANPPYSAKLGGTPYHSPKLHPWPCSNMGMQQGTDRHTHRQSWPQHILLGYS